MPEVLLAAFVATTKAFVNATEIEWAPSFADGLPNSILFAVICIVESTTHTLAVEQHGTPSTDTAAIPICASLRNAKVEPLRAENPMLAPKDELYRTLPKLMEEPSSATKRQGRERGKNVSPLNVTSALSVATTRDSPRRGFSAREKVIDPKTVLFPPEKLAHPRSSG